MALRQYIGARYVPVFAGEWDINKTYEPLSIVTVANVGSYTSKKYVPAGVAITDTDYWVESANLSGQLSALTTRVDNLDSEYGDLLNYSLNTARRIVTIADSYGEHPSISDNWQQKVETLGSGVDYWYHMHQNGAGYYRPGHEISTYYNSVKGNIVDKDTITDVIICLGQNDASESAGNVRNAAYNFFVEVHGDMPNAHIWVGYPEAMTYLSDSQMNSMINIIAGIEAVTSRLNYCTWMRDLEYIMHDTAMEDSGSPGHPTSAGATEIARGVLCYINGGSYKYSFSTKTTVNWADGDTSDAIITLDGPVSKIYLEGIIKSSGTTITLTSNSWVKVGDIASCRLANRLAQGVPVIIRDMNSSAGRDSYVMGMLKTVGTEIYVHIYSGSETIRPWFPDTTIVMPTIWA